jgi:uncharacterized protein YqiB (DUF1249 family)
MLKVKSLFGTLYRVYSMTFAELKAVLQHNAVKKASPASLTAPGGYTVVLYSQTWYTPPSPTLVS